MTKIIHVKHVLIASILGAFAFASLGAAPSYLEPDQEREYKVTSPSDLLRKDFGEIMLQPAKKDADVRIVEPLHVTGTEKADAIQVVIVGPLRVTTVEKLDIILPLAKDSSISEAREQLDVLIVGPLHLIRVEKADAIQVHVVGPLHVNTNRESDFIQPR